MMTLRKALNLIEFLINSESRLYRDMINPTKPWNVGNTSIAKLTRQLADFHKDNVRVLNIIKKELVPDCSHPKKMRDTADGQEYCMNCNLDM